MTKIALISGITGQDGSYLAEFLLEKDYKVHGIVRRNSTPSNSRISHFLDRVTLHDGDLTDQASINKTMFAIKPDEVYNLAAQSFVGCSWNLAVSTGDVTGLGAVRVFEAARQLKVEHGVDPRVYQASTSELFGNADGNPQSELTPLKPRSPYGTAKLYAHEMARVYRESHGMFVSCGILFNHESPRRGKEFVTRKITDAVARVKLGVQDKLQLGNLDAMRDWGFAGDYVRSMHLMLQQSEPDDYVIATGVKHSVRQFASLAFAHVGLDWHKHVEMNPALLRPAEVDVLCGDAAKANEKLGWEPTVSFEQLVAMMVDADMSLSLWLGDNRRSDTLAS